MAAYDPTEQLSVMAFFVEAVAPVAGIFIGIGTLVFLGRMILKGWK